MTQEQAQKALKFIQDRLAQQQWMVDIIKEIPQIDRAKIIAEINEQLTRYATEGWGKNQKSSSAYAEERGENDEK